jgi:hypothetical protein
MRLRGPITVLALLLLVGLARAQEEDAPPVSELDQARATVQAEYAESLDRVARMTNDERLALGGTLLAAARETDRAETERFVLADLAVEVCAPVGTKASSDLASEALILAQELGFYTPVEQTMRQREMAMGRLATLQANRADPAAIEPAARKVIQTTLAYCDALIAAEQLADARRMLQYVRNLAQRHDIEDLDDAIERSNTYHRWALDREAAFTQARSRLSRAIDGGTVAAIDAAHIELAELFISYDGNLAAAAEQLDGVEHPLAGALATWQAVDVGEPVADETLLEAVVALRQQVAKLDGDARARIGAEAVALCDAYLAQSTSDESQVRGRLHRGQVEQLLGESDTDRLIAQLHANYKDFAGELLLMDEGQSQVTYGFSDAVQLDDWIAEGRAWQVANGVLAQTEGEGGIRNHLRFRADEPFEVQVRGTGVDQVAIVAVYYRWGEDRVAGTCEYYLRRPAIANHGHDRRQGLELSTFGKGHVWTDAEYTMGRNKAYVMRLTFDGAGGVSCWVDDVLVHEYVAAPGDPTFTDGSMAVRLVARTVNPQSPTIYDDVVIIGDLLPSPTFRPAEGN